MTESPKNSDPASPRARSMTSLCLDWLAERMRRAEKIRSQISNGTYRVDSEAVAQSIMNRGPAP